MKIQWKFADGTASEVEVNEEIGNFITASRREEDSAERRNRRHCYSLDAIVYEGLEYGQATRLKMTRRRKSVGNTLMKLSRIFVKSSGSG